MHTAHYAEKSRIGVAHQQVLGREIPLRGHADKAVRAPIRPVQTRMKITKRTQPQWIADFRTSALRWCPTAVTDRRCSKFAKRTHRSVREFKVRSFRKLPNEPTCRESQIQDFKSQIFRKGDHGRCYSVFTKRTHCSAGAEREKGGGG